jgi:hypothetical protein
MAKSLGSRAAKAIDIVVELAKQLITLSTGVIAITISLAKEIFAGQTAGLSYLSASWIAYLFCITFGVWVILAAAGVLDPIPRCPDKRAKRRTNDDDKPSSEPSRPLSPQPKATPYLRFNVRFPSAFQILAFVVATTSTAFAGCKQLTTIRQPTAAAPSPSASAPSSHAKAVP